MCEEHPKDSIHALWLCDQAQFVWKLELTYTSYMRRGLFFTKKKKEKKKEVCNVCFSFRYLSFCA